MNFKEKWAWNWAPSVVQVAPSVARSVALGLWLFSMVSPAIALDNPRSLATLKADPLLPSLTLHRSLSPMERRVIEETIVQLDQQAQGLLESNHTNQAFDLWFRVLNLRRGLGRSAEIMGLGTVGEQAWRTGSQVELKAITDRLSRLEIDLRKSPHTSLGEEAMALGMAYQQVRDLNAAQNFYQFQLQIAQEQQNISRMGEILTQLIQVEWGSLNYQLSREYTQQKLALLRSTPVTVESLQEERSLLNSLAFLAKHSGDYETQISALEETIALTLDLGFVEEAPTLWTDLGNAYRDNGQADLAIQNYYKAYHGAQETEQFEMAQTILFSLGQLQEAEGQLLSAIETYELLRQVHRYSSNLLGLLESYDRLGQLYLQTQQPEQAQAQFQQGLALAKRLKYKESDFEARLQQFAP